LNYKPNSNTEKNSSAPGDILAVDPLWIPDLIKNGLLQKSDSTETPLVTYFYPLFYNIDILREAGFSRPPKNRSEFLAFAKAVTKTKAQRYGLALSLSPGNSRGIYTDVYPWIWAAGASLLNENSQKAIVETLAFLANLNREGLIHPDSFSMGEEEKLNAFIEGRTAFILGKVQYIEILKTQLGPSHFSLSSIPPPTHIQAGASLAHPLGCWRLLNQEAIRKKPMFLFHS
jgi:multiple sugar transport system substrate-binding protein